MRITIGVGLELDRRGLSEPASTSFSSHEASGGEVEREIPNGTVAIVQGSQCLVCIVFRSRAAIVCCMAQVRIYNKSSDADWGAKGWPRTCLRFGGASGSFQKSELHSTM